ncbi:hypothetical protein Bbelb_063280 [Branchiostoma belcheri]|nr:hypothetical protein Bbelb_063280 [Branchiostoma belcheri]
MRLTEIAARARQRQLQRSRALAPEETMGAAPFPRPVRLTPTEGRCTVYLKKKKTSRTIPAVITMFLSAPEVSSHDSGSDETSQINAGQDNFEFRPHGEL